MGAGLNWNLVGLVQGWWVLWVFDVGSLGVIGLFGCLSEGSSAPSPAHLQAQRLLGAEDLSHPLVLVQVPRCLPTTTLVHFGEDEPFSASPLTKSRHNIKTRLL